MCLILLAGGWTNPPTGQTDDDDLPPPPPLPSSLPPGSDVSGGGPDGQDGYGGSGGSGYRNIPIERQNNNNVPTEQQKAGQLMSALFQNKCGYFSLYGGC